MSALLAAVIPTRNRGTLAQDAARSLREQDCEVEVFVSDNSDAPGPHELRPDRELAVADHWDWALREAMARSKATHFIIHHDRRVAMPRSWGAIERIAARWPELLITAPVDAISDVPPPLRLWQAPWTGKLFAIRTAVAAKLIAGARIAESVHALPLLNNSFVPRAVLQSIIDRFGDICRSTGPDTAFLARFLALHDRYLFADRPAGILHAPHRSANLGSVRNAGGDFDEYVRLHGDRPWLDAAPVPGLNLGSNMLFHEYERVRRETGDRLPPIDRDAYLRELEGALRWIEDRAQRKALASQLGVRAPIDVRSRLVTFAARLGLVRAFRDDESALRYALAHPRLPRDTHEHLAMFDAEEVAA